MNHSLSAVSYRFLANKACYWYDVVLLSSLKLYLHCKPIFKSTKLCGFCVKFSLFMHYISIYSCNFKSVILSFEIVNIYKAKLYYALCHSIVLLWFFLQWKVFWIKLILLIFNDLFVFSGRQLCTCCFFSY